MTDTPDTIDVGRFETLGRADRGWLARVMGATLKSGEGLSHAVGAGRHAYLVLGTGAAKIDGVTLNARDGAALIGGRTVTLTAPVDAEIVLVDAH